MKKSLTSNVVVDTVRDNIFLTTMVAAVHLFYSNYKARLFDVDK